MKKEIWFDMDGTIADLYGVDGWLEDLHAESARPYREAKPLINMQALARVLNGLKRKGYAIGIISWTAKGGSVEYNAKVAETKKAWLAKHLASVRFDRVDIVTYGEPKQNGRDGVLFDDEEPNRKAWNGRAYGVNEIVKTLRGLN